MVTGMVLASGYTDSPRGWGGVWGIVAGAFVVYLWWRWDKWRQDKKAGEGSPSPAGPPPPVSRENAQVDHVSSHVSRETRATGEGGETDHWAGTIRRSNGGIKRFYTVAKHVAQTGSAPPAGYQPPPRRPVPDELPADDIDLPLSGDDEGEEWGEEYDEPQPVQRPAVQAPPRETRDQYAERLHRAGEDKPTIVAGLIAHYGVSRATAYRIHDRLPRRGRPAA
jgi:hypothetical protein